MKVIILAAGKGNRLSPLTNTVPKPLIKINSKPIIDRIFESLPKEIDEIIIVVKHLKEKIISHVESSFNSRKIIFVEQIELPGTFGAISSVKNLIEKNEKFLVINGDDIHDKDELSKYFINSRSFGIQLMKMPGYHSIQVDNAGMVSGFSPQTDYEKENGAYIATGAYLLDSNIFINNGIKLRDGEYGLPQTILSQRNTYPIKGINTKKWISINSFNDIENAEAYFKSIEGAESFNPQLAKNLNL